MIDMVETLIEAASADDVSFRDVVCRLGTPDTLTNLMFDEAVRVQGKNPERAAICIMVIDRLRLVPV